jgi:hypothetical protein
MNGEQHEDPSAFFERTLSVVAGDRLPLNKADQRKMVTIVVGVDDADVAITRAGLFVQYPYRRGPFTYFPSLAAPMLSAFLRFARASPPCSFRVEPEELSLIRIGIQPSARWMWVRATGEAVLVMSRRAIGSGDPPPEPTPLAPWAPARKLVATFGQPVACPHCAVQSARMRAYRDFLVCSSCGRSWEPSQELLQAATMAEAR